MIGVYNILCNEKSTLFKRLKESGYHIRITENYINVFNNGCVYIYKSGEYGNTAGEESMDLIQILKSYSYRIENIKKILLK